MNRLNFTQMVNQNLLGHQKNKFFNVTQIDLEKYCDPVTQTSIMKEANESFKMKSKINSMIFSVHEQLKEGKDSTNSLKTISKKTKMKQQLNSEKQIKNDKNRNLSLARMKVLSRDKPNQHAHKSTATTANCITYEDHKRIISILQRQKELESMLMEYKLIMVERRSLEQDIFAARHTLEDLQHRINNSLKELKSKRTYFECHGLTCTEHNNNVIPPDKLGK